MPATGVGGGGGVLIIMLCLNILKSIEAIQL